MKTISIIVPTLNESSSIQTCLVSLQPFRASGHEVIVVDGGSIDTTISLIQDMSDQVLNSPRGRARQMNLGAAYASGELLLFLHADTTLPENAEHLLQDVAEHDLIWGRFDVRLSGDNPLFRIIEFLMNLRSRLTGIATGDQAMFVSRQLFNQASEFPDIELMEDITLSEKLKKYCQPVCLKSKVLTSSRRWEQHGITKTILSMCLMRLRYAFGVSPDILVKKYE